MTALFFRILQHLLPTGEAWRTAIDTMLRRLVEGLSGVGADARAFVDRVYLDLFPHSTRALAAWEAFYDLRPTPNQSELSRRQALAAEWRASGGQSPRYIQDVLQTAGFEVWVHEPWEAPHTPRDPRDYATVPLSGNVQCGHPDAQCGDPWAQCDDLLPPGAILDYWSNLSQMPIAPPPIPADPARWPFFIYLAGRTFPDRAVLDRNRLPELRRLIQKLKPAHTWIVLVYTLGGYLATEDLDYLMTESDDFLME